jgi:hypothetical protein
MSNLGQMIGVIEHSFKITNDAKESVTLSVKIDFSTASDQDIKNWLASNRIIAGQRPWRVMSLNELKQLNGKTFAAQSIGQKVKTRAEQVQALVSAGLPKTLAEFAVDNPTKFAEVSQGMVSAVSNTVEHEDEVEDNPDGLDEYMEQDETIEDDNN